MKPILEQAMAIGTRRFVLLSSSQLLPGDPIMGEVHAWLADNALEWAVLRPSWFMQNFSEGPHGQTIRDESTIYSATANGRVGFISADNIAEVAVALLTSEGSLDEGVCGGDKSGAGRVQQREAGRFDGERAAGFGSAAQPRRPGSPLQPSLSVTA